MHQLLRQRASRLVQRRQDDIKDESSEFASLSSQSILKVFKIYLNRPRYLSARVFVLFRCLHRECWLRLIEACNCVNKLLFRRAKYYWRSCLCHP